MRFDSLSQRGLIVLDVTEEASVADFQRAARLYDRACDDAHGEACARLDDDSVGRGVVRSLRRRKAAMPAATAG